MTVVVVVLAMRGGGSSDFRARAAAVCEEAQRAHIGEPQKPSSVAQALEIDHAALAATRREVSELEALEA